MRLSSPPLLNNHPGTVHFSISYVSDTDECFLHTSEVPDMKTACNEAGNLVIRLDRCIALVGDIKVEFYNKPKVMRKKNILLRFWFNTYFVNELRKGKCLFVVCIEFERIHCPLVTENNGGSDPNLEYVLTKNEIDFALKDKQNKLFPADFKVNICLIAKYIRVRQR